MKYLSAPFVYLVAVLAAIINSPLLVAKWLAAVTFVTAHNLLRLGGLQTVPLATCVVDDPDFEKKMLGGIELIQTNQQKMLSDVDRLDKESKKALEELTKVKNQMNSIAEFEIALKKVNVALRNQERISFRSPVERIEGTPELRAALNLFARKAVNKNGDMNGVIGTLQKALGEDSSPGSTLINQQLFREIYDTLSTYGIWNTLGVRRMGTKLTKLPVKTARAQAGFILTEGGTIADDTNKAGTTVDLEVEVIAALLNVSLQLLQDAEFDVTRDVLDDFVEAFNERLDYAAFMGDGTADATNGGMTGLFNFGTAAVATATHTTIATLTLEDFIRCLTTVDPIVLMRPARWWMHPRNLARVGGIKDLNGRPLFQTALEAPSPGSIGSILGYPLTLGHILPSTDAANNKVAAFGDPASFVVGVRQDFEFEASDEHKWNTYQRSFRCVGRAGVKGRRALGSAILTTAAA